VFATFAAADADADRFSTTVRPYTAHLALRRFVDVYHVVADRLAECDADEVFDEKRFLDECLRVGKQWALQRRVASEESVSLELFKPALRRAGHRGLLEPTTPELSTLRMEFADEITSTVRRINDIESLAR
jgi:glycerol-3-phosphate O-acyltransferase